MPSSSSTFKYPLAFWRMSISSMLFFAGFNMLLPELPQYFMDIGGEAEQKGYIIALFTLVAMLSRPFSGKLADTVGRVPVMFFGILIAAIAGSLYPIFTFVSGFLVLRFFHGLSTGFTPTGNAAYIADIIPQNMRGEAMGYLGFFNSLGMAAGPAIGSQLMLWLDFGYSGLFYSSVAMSVAAFVVLLGMKETLVDRHRFSWKFLKVKWEDIFEPRVARPFVVLLFTAFSFGVILTVAPDMAGYVGMENKGTFFSFFTLSSLLSRLSAGKLSDKKGREIVLQVSSLLLVVALIVIGIAENRTVFLTGAVLYGFALGLNSPTIYAWAIDLSAEKHKGRGIGMVFMGLEIAIGLGALVSGYLFADNFERIGWPFFLSSGLCFMAFIYVTMLRKNMKPQ